MNLISKNVRTIYNGGSNMGKKCRYAKTWMNSRRTHCFSYCTSPSRSKTGINRQGFYKDTYPYTGCKDQFGTSGWW